MLKIQDYFKDEKIFAKLMNLIVPYTGFKNMRIEKNSKGSVLYVDDTAELWFDNKNKIIKMYLPAVKELRYGSIPCEILGNATEFVFPNLERVDDEVDGFAMAKKVVAPNLKIVGNYVDCSPKLQEFDAPSLNIAGKCFLRNAFGLKIINVPKLEEVGSSFLAYNEQLEEISLPSLRGCIGACLVYNEKLIKLYAPKVEEIDDSFRSVKLENLDLPNVVLIAGSSFNYSDKLREVNLPKLQESKSTNSLIVQALNDNMRLKQEKRKTTEKLKRVTNNIKNTIGVTHHKKIGGVENTEHNR